MKTHLPLHSDGKITSSAPFTSNIIFPVRKSLKTMDIRFRSDVNSRVSKISYSSRYPKILIPDHKQNRCIHQLPIKNALKIRDLKNSVHLEQNFEKFL